MHVALTTELQTHKTFFVFFAFFRFAPGDKCILLPYVAIHWMRYRDGNQSSETAAKHHRYCRIEHSKRCMLCSPETDRVNRAHKVGISLAFQMQCSTFGHLDSGAGEKSTKSQVFSQMSVRETWHNTRPSCHDANSLDYDFIHKSIRSSCFCSLSAFDEEMELLFFSEVGSLMLPLHWPILVYCCQSRPSSIYYFNSINWCTAPAAQLQFIASNKRR